MAIVLGGVTLNPNMLWAERLSYSPVIQSVQLALDGSTVLFSGVKDKGMDITLVSLEDQGWLTYSMVEGVIALANTPQTIHPLTIGDLQWNVVFRHHESPAFSFNPLIPRAVPLAGDYFTGQIKLMTV